MYSKATDSEQAIYFLSHEVIYPPSIGRKPGMKLGLPSQNLF